MDNLKSVPRSVDLNRFYCTYHGDVEVSLGDECVTAGTVNAEHGGDVPGEHLVNVLHTTTMGAFKQ